MAEPSDSELEALAVRAFDELPEDLRKQVSNLAFVIADEPPEGKPWLATYSGVPLTQRSVFRGWEWPHRITIYRGPLMRLCGGDPDRLESEMRHIVRHEIAHYFGISDARLIEIDRY